MKKILVTAATGSLGMEVITNLLTKTSAKNIYALARSEEKAAPLKKLGVTVRIGDYDDFDSLLKAFKGIDTLYMVSNTDVSKRITQQDNVSSEAVAIDLSSVKPAVTHHRLPFGTLQKQITAPSSVTQNVKSDSTDVTKSKHSRSLNLTEKDIVK